jgi:transcriptional regulator with XRE-family HTH domain
MVQIRGCARYSNLFGKSIKQPSQLEKKNKNSTPFVGQRIRAARKAEGLSLEELGRRIGVSNQAISAIETGKANPSKQTLISLARVLRRDFGEEWLAQHLSESEDYYLITDRSEAGKETLMRLFGEFLESKYSTQDVRFIKARETDISVPLAFEITNATTLNPLEDEKYISVPSGMTHRGKKTVGVIVKGEPIRDAFICAGDVVVLGDCPDKVGGQTVLALVGGELMVRRWSRNGRKIRLTPINPDFNPTDELAKSIKCVGEITGLLRYTLQAL